MAHLMASPNRRRMALAVAGAVGAAAMFASGVLVARATMDSDPREPEKSTGDVATIAPAPSINTGGAAVPAATSNGMAGEMSRDAGMGYSMRAGCQAPIGDLFSNGMIDPAKAGFVMNVPGAGFSLQSISLRSEGECDSNGQATSGTLVLDTYWRHDATGIGAWVSQSVSPDQRPNTMADSYASFWLDGYYYTLGVDSYYYFAADDTGGATEPAPDATDLPAAGSGVSGAAGPATMPVRPGEPDPRAVQVLGELVAQLAPGIPDACFAHQRMGTWDDVAALGIGDPRGAVPGSYSEQYLNVRVWEPADPSCGGPAVDPMGNSFDAGFSDGNTGSLNINVYGSEPQVERYPGYLGQGSISWSNDSYWFNVSGWEASGPISNETLGAIARALDPAFDQRCVIVNSELSAADLEALGLRTPVAPDGYRLDSTNGWSGEPSGDCTGVTGVSTSLYATWYLAADGAEGISVQASRGPDQFAGNTASAWGFAWTAADGTGYSVSGPVSIIGEDAFIAVATSVDPAFDRSSLADSPDGGAVPMPKPIR